MERLSIDIETYSSVDLTKCGVYKYANSDDFEVLLFAYSVDDGEVNVVDLACGEQIPNEIVAAVKDPNIIKWAFNAQFERVCLSVHFGVNLPIESWRCSMVWSATLGLPLSLKGVGAVLGLDKQKLAEGDALIRYFCKPCTPTAANGHRTRNLPKHAPEQWQRFKEYNKRDVEVELGIKHSLRKFPVMEQEWENYRIDQIINDRGVMIDQQLVKAALDCDAEYSGSFKAEAKMLTGLENPNSTTQLLGWLKEQGVYASSLDKSSVADLLERTDGDVHRVLQLRQMLSKSSVKKYEAMQKCLCDDGRLHGLIQFYGTRTGRYAGRLVQVQNLPQNHLDDLEAARAIIRNREFSKAQSIHSSVPDLLSQLIRTAFIAKPGYKLFVADYSAIEARIIAFLSGETWRQEVFANGGDIYCASASQMFHVPVEKHGVNGHLRAKGKIAELALGYGGSVGALKAMGAIEMGVKEDELQPLVTAWRNSNTRITKFWWDVDKAVKKALTTKTPVKLGKLVFEYRSGILFIQLPSGRRLAYVKPRLERNQYGQISVTYEGLGENRKWMRIESYGPKFVENIVQATARDILAEAMVRLERAGYRIVMHIHDEVVIEAPETASLEVISEIMAQQPKWAKGLLLNAEGFVSKFYKKD